MPLTRAEIESVLAPLERAKPLPRRAFVDEEVFAFEQRRIFGRAWLCVGRSDEVELPGQWVRCFAGGEPVLVVRGADLQLRAFFDVCRHRGVSLVGGAPCGRAPRLECPYHGWTYELDGRLVWPMLDHSLEPVRVDTWRGFVFVTLSRETPPLARWLGITPPWLTEEALACVRRGQRTTYDVNANWKLIVENFQESHHFARVHRALERLTPTSKATSWLGDGPWLGGIMEIEHAETVSVDGSRHGRPMISSEGRVFDAMLFPGLFTSLQPDYLLTYRLMPAAANRTRIVADVYFHPAAFGARFEPNDVYDFWARVNAEDRAICEDQQANAASRAFEPACYVAVEEGMHAFDRMVAAAHLEDE